MLAHEWLGQGFDANDRKTGLFRALLPERDAGRRRFESRLASGFESDGPDDEQTVVLRFSDQEREELDRRRIGPLQILDDEDEWRSGRFAADAEESVQILHRLHDAVVHPVLLPLLR